MTIINVIDCCCRIKATLTGRLGEDQDGDPRRARYSQPLLHSSGRRYLPHLKYYACEYTRGSDPKAFPSPLDIMTAFGVFYMEILHTRRVPTSPLPTPCYEPDIYAMVRHELPLNSSQHTHLLPSARRSHNAHPCPHKALPIPASPPSPKPVQLQRLR